MNLWHVSQTAKLLAHLAVLLTLIRYGKASTLPLFTLGQLAMIALQAVWIWKRSADPGWDAPWQNEWFAASVRLTITVEAVHKLIQVSGKQFARWIMGGSVALLMGTVGYWWGNLTPLGAVRLACLGALLATLAGFFQWLYQPFQFAPWHVLLLTAYTGVQAVASLAGRWVPRGSEWWLTLDQGAVWLLTGILCGWVAFIRVPWWKQRK